MDGKDVEIHLNRTAVEFISLLWILGSRTRSEEEAITRNTRTRRAARLCGEFAMVDKGKSRKDEVVTREYTIHLHKRLHGWYNLVVLFFFWFLFSFQAPTFVRLSLPPFQTLIS
jgi:hypothetical protein